MNTIAGDEFSIPGKRMHKSRTYWTFVMTLTLLLGMGMLAALITLTQNASAQTSQTAQKPDAPIVGGVPGSPDCGPNWVVANSPNPGAGGNYLAGVSAVAANNVWAVGYYLNISGVLQTLIQHWDGIAWTTVGSPNQGTNHNYLTAVSAVAANNVWAVGYYLNAGGVERTLILHWDGTVWGLVSSPNPGAGGNYLAGVSAVAANNVWAVGYYLNTSDVDSTLVLHWNGNAWTVVPSPSPGTIENKLLGVSAMAANNVWAVGYYLSNSNLVRTLILHWNGSIWSQVPSPNESASSNYLYGVSAVAANNVWAVGYYSNSNTEGTVILHWDGSIWSLVSSPNPSTVVNNLYGITAVSANDVWAVGYYSNSSGSASTLILHWDGTAWTQASSPNPGPDNNQLLGVDAVSANDVWAVGVISSGTASQTLIERHNPCTGTPTRTPLPTQTPGGPTATPVTCTLQFSDVPNPSTFYDYIECLACRGIINGYACGSPGEPCDGNHDPYFRPNANVTRGQIAKIVALSAQINTSVTGQTFDDVPPGSTFYTYVEQLYALSVMNGYPCGGAGEPCNPPTNRPYFRPNSNATRGQLAKIDANAAGYQDPPTGRSFEDIPINSTFYTYTQRLTSRGVMSGYACGGAGEPCNPPGNLPYFRPSANVTRGQTSKIVANTFYPNCQTP